MVTVRDCCQQKALGFAVFSEAYMAMFFYRWHQALAHEDMIEAHSAPILTQSKWR